MGLALAAIFAATPARPQDFRESFRPSLGGLTGVAVAVSAIDPALAGRGMARDALQAEVEARLRQHGIRVLTTQELVATPGRPVLAVAVLGRQAPGGGSWALAIQAELFQQVRLERNPDLVVPASTWRSTGAVGVTASPDQVRTIVREQIEEFLRAYAAANPQK